MNAVEIEQAISLLAEQAFDAASFPYAFLEAFGNKATTIKRLQSGSSNASDIEGGVLQRSNIHIAVCAEGEVTATLNILKASPATSRLNRLYVELLRNNPDWGTAERRHDMNHFMARLIFCFFAEDTDIFNGDNLFTATIEQMSAKDSSNTHEVIGEIFRSMNIKPADRKSAGIRSWADGFPYVNGGLFSGSTDVPRFTRIARSYLLHVGTLDWKQINPDIFGSMIQAVADIPLTNFRGIELRDFPAEIARLALIIAEYQCDVLYRGQKLALAEFLPLDAQNWITQGNALQIDWLSVCPPTGTAVKMLGDDLFSAPTSQAQVDFENEGGETYICGNPPYLGSTWQSKEQKADLERIFKNRTYLPTGLIDSKSIVTSETFALFDAPLWNMALIASRLHLVWIATVCGKMKTDFRYSNTMGWNTFPVPKLTEKNIQDLTRCAEDILLAREAHFPATIADLYNPEKMPENLHHAHERNDEVLERIYIGRRFKNDTERLEKLFDLYTKMTNKKGAA